MRDEDNRVFLVTYFEMSLFLLICNENAADVHRIVNCKNKSVRLGRPSETAARGAFLGRSKYDYAESVAFGQAVVLKTQFGDPFRTR